MSVFYVDSTVFEYGKKFKKNQKKNSKTPFDREKFVD